MKLNPLSGVSPVVGFEKSRDGKELKKKGALSGWVKETCAFWGDDLLRLQT